MTASLVVLGILILGCTAYAVRKFKSTTDTVVMRMNDMEREIMAQARHYYEEKLRVLGAMVDLANSSRISKKEAELALLSARHASDRRVEELQRTIPPMTADQVVHKLDEAKDREVK